MFVSENVYGRNEEHIKGSLTQKRQCKIYVEVVVTYDGRFDLNCCLNIRVIFE